MKLIATLLLVVPCWAQPKPTSSAVRKITVQQTDGGSMVTKLSENIAVNADTSLKRRWFVLNDSTSPVKLTDTGVHPVWQDSDYVFAGSGAITAKKDIRAITVVAVLFDIWGEHMRTLARTSVQDVMVDEELEFLGGWPASENEVGRMYTSVVYVDRVMLADGKIWQADRGAIPLKLAEIQIRISESGLAPDAPKAGK